MIMISKGQAEPYIVFLISEFYTYLVGIATPTAMSQCVFYVCFYPIYYFYLSLKIVGINDMLVPTNVGIIISFDTVIMSGPCWVFISHMNLNVNNATSLESMNAKKNTSYPPMSFM